MTTIAWDGVILASDSQCTTGGMPWDTQKIWRLDDGRLYGACGELSAALAVRRWFNAVFNGEATIPEEPKIDPKTGVRGLLVQHIPEKPKIDPNTGFHGLLIQQHPGGNITVHKMDDQLEPMLVKDCKFHAVGSGRDFAMAAMHFGRGAHDAIALAAQYDVWTGGPIQTLTF